MSAEIESVNNGSASKRLVTVDSVVSWQLPLLVVLFVTVIFVSIKMVVQRHESRTMFMQLQKLEKERDKLAARWSRLKLEQGTLLNQVRVERNARWDLNMKMPKTSEIKTIREPVIISVEVDESVVDMPKAATASTVALDIE